MDGGLTMIEASVILILVLHINTLTSPMSPMIERKKSILTNRNFILKEITYLPPMIYVEAEEVTPNPCGTRESSTAPLPI